MTRSLVRNALALLAVVALAACESATSSRLRLDITPDRTEYTTGSDVLLTVRNLGDEPVTYSFCTWTVQRRTVTGWVEEDSEAVICPAAILLLGPGQSATGTIGLPDHIPSGRYRVYLPAIGEPASDQVIDEPTQAEKYSTPFNVQAPVALDAR
ncbi:MAG TPA: hypothetical protein VGB15_19240 [Longimicrobium sp.]|jgi:hypothetical protein